MAAWLLRSGRLGSLKFDSWGTLRLHPTVGFCIEAKEPAKAVKSTKSPEKSEDERAALRAYKTAVAFPVKFSDPRILSPFLGVTEEPISSTATSDIAPASVISATKFVVAESESVAIPASPDPYRHQEVVSHILADEALPVILLAGEASVEASGKGSVPGEETPAVTIDDVVKTAKVSSKPGDSAAEELSSSSSSDSDTDSECDPEDKLEVETETRSCSSELQQPSHQEKGEIEELIVTGVTKGITRPETELAQSIVVAFRDNSQDLGFEILTAPKAAGELTSSEFPTDAAPTITDALYEALPLVVVHSEAHKKAWPNAPGNAVDLLTELTGLGDAGEESWEKTAIGPVESETVSANVAADHPAEVGSSAHSEKKLVDSAQVLVEATGEKLHAETVAEQPEEPAEVPPEPEEPFDNSTYKNYQHHSYTSYTFADLDVEMAKYRLPQPSSGKPSPRH
ncbi:uncharacterized protein ndufv3 isoform X2 [Girardinichthys multiradiatus]|uniref:uncharacterized protein ndufv3 isoform X2 n=1 Tax=Girardinichthys multiradiatus TaxID=208333 RepID=UPI001FACC847|nr:uncharacterized protein ndufv3 isoform X2 [Girardinichthys multiradiatus]